MFITLLNSSKKKPKRFNCYLETLENSLKTSLYAESMNTATNLLMVNEKLSIISGLCSWSGQKWIIFSGEHRLDNEAD